MIEWNGNRENFVHIKPASDRYNIHSQPFATAAAIGTRLQCYTIPVIRKCAQVYTFEKNNKATESKNP